VKAEQFGSLAGRTLARLAKHVERALTPYELTLPQYRLLALLADGATITPPTVTSVVDGLVARGLVERRPDPNDRRRLPLALTGDGEALVRAANTAVGKHLYDLLAAVDDPDERAAAKTGLVAWQNTLDAHRERRTATEGTMSGPRR
jgi:DNA-binding MarR family transcriptional regulator